MKQFFIKTVDFYFNSILLTLSDGKLLIKTLWKTIEQSSWVQIYKQIKGKVKMIKMKVSIEVLFSDNIWAFMDRQMANTWFGV